MAVEGYDGITFQAGDRVELHPNAKLWKEGSKTGAWRQYGEVVGIMSRSEAVRDGAGENRVRVVMEGVEGVHAGPPQAFRLVY
tara:strand:+ start:4703 stop:4951 length:249 start_codon:yes stop_codon:yes gene_type:complete